MDWPPQSLDLTDVEAVWDHWTKQNAANIQTASIFVLREAGRAIPED